MAMAFVAMAAFSACSLVLENRDACPSELEISVSGVRERTAVMVNGERVADVERDTAFVVDIPRGEVRIVAFSGVSAADGSGFPGTDPMLCGFPIPEGLDSPPLYLGSEVVTASGERTSARVHLRKAFCALTLSVEGPPGWGEPYRVEVNSSSAGTAADGTPLPGRFSYRLPPEGYPAVVRLPRQPPESDLSMDVVMGDMVLRTFSLWAYLQKSGYDWDAPDLADASLTLSLSVTSFTVSSGVWKETVPMDIVI